MLTKTIMLILFTGIRKYVALYILLIATLLLSCLTESDRSRPYVYFPTLWDSWFLTEVWYYGANDTLRAYGTGTLELKSFGEKFGDEHYSLDFEVTVHLPSDTILITRKENGIYYVEDVEAGHEIYFFPDSGADWHSDFYYYHLLRMSEIPATGGILWTDWDRIK